jgi:hypothetical protein
VSWPLTIAWLLALVYATIPALWLIVHGGIGLWRRVPPYLLLPLWPALWVIAGLITRPWRRELLYDHPLSWLAALPLFALAFYIYRRAGGSISGRQISGLAEVEPRKHEQRLATSGLHARMRHPLYLAHLSVLLGLTLGSGLLVLFWLTAFAFVTGWLMIVLEERELERRFGYEYRLYRQRVPAILPRIGR